MNEDAAAELQALRERAYGPDADILRDPTAYDRLHELEEQLRTEQQGPERSGDVTAPPSPDAPAAASTQDPESAGATAPSSDDRARETGNRASWSPVTRLPPFARAFWLVSVMAVATLAASVTWGLASVPVISEGSGARQIAALEPDPSTTSPSFGNTDAPPVGFQFAGYTLITAINSSDGVDSECLVVFRTEDVDDESGFPNGPTYYGCGAGAFPPTASVQIHAGSPAEARERFGEGAALQFVLQGDRVGVFVDTAPQEPIN